MATPKNTPVKPVFQFWRYRLATVIRVHNRAARLCGDNGKVTLAEFIDIADRQHWRCIYCAADLKDVGASMDHILARSRGGLHTASNVQALCMSCNCKKQRMTDAEFREYFRLMYSTNGQDITASASQAATGESKPLSRFTSLPRELRRAGGKL